MDIVGKASEIALGKLGLCTKGIRNTILLKGGIV
jgi:hypothetical protein